MVKCALMPNTWSDMSTICRKLLHNWLSIYLSTTQLQSVFINSSYCLPTRTAFHFPVPSVTVCWHSNIGNDSFFKFFWFLFFFVLGLGGLFYRSKVTNTTCNSRNVYNICSRTALHRTIVEHVKQYTAYGRFDSRLDSNSNRNARFVFDLNANSRFAGPWVICARECGVMLPFSGTHG